MKKLKNPFKICCLIQEKSQEYGKDKCLQSYINNKQVKKHFNNKAMATSIQNYNEAKFDVNEE